MIFFGLHSWRGESGRRYMFKSVLTKHGLPDDSGGIYIFVRRRWAFFLEPLYVGKAANLKSRLLGHEKWGSAWWLHGATEQHVKEIKSEAERQMVSSQDNRGRPSYPLPRVKKVGRATHAASSDHRPSWIDLQEAKPWAGST